MWLVATDLGDGDFNIPIPAGISGVVIAAIFAAAFVLSVLLRRRKVDPVEPAKVGVDEAVSAMAQRLVWYAEQLEERDRLLDEAYQQGFVPIRRPSRRPLPDRSGPDEQA